MLAYLIGRERTDADERELRDLKTRLFVAHPDWDVESIFEADTAFAPALSDDEMESSGPLSANEIEAALDIMKELGFAVQDI